MGIQIIFVFIAVLVVRWYIIRHRFQQLENRIDILSRRVAMPPASPSVKAPTPVQQWDLRVYPPATQQPVPPPPKIVERPSIPERPAIATSQSPSASPSSTDWEAVVGGNWLNKLGVFILVIGIALALGYSFTYMGPAGRVGISLAVSIGMIGTGVVVERRERYRTFARGLIGGGWAALYFTVYAMYAVDAARVVHSPLVAAVLLMAVAVGMIVQSLRYRSEAVSGLAYFIAFVTLAITEVNGFSLVALAPLAASLLYVARRFEWSRFAMFGAIATYATCALRGDTGAPLWQAQSIFAIYWLLFEAFDILAGSAWLLPLNAAGFLGLSLMKWSSVAPDRVWQFCSVAAVAYLASGFLRMRAGRWHGALTVAAGLAAGAICLKLDHEWLAISLLTEAELLYLMGVRLRIPYLRYIAGGIFALELSYVLTWQHTGTWTSIAALSAAVFYLNRFLFSSDLIFGYAGAALAALIAFERAPNNDAPLAWMLMAVVAFVIGWLRGLEDFRFQAFGLGALGLAGMVLRPNEPPYSLAIGAAVLFAGAFCGPANRLLHVAASALLGLLLYREVSGSMLTMAWGAEGVALLAAGFPLRDRILRLCGIGLLLVCILKLFVYDLSSLETLPRIFSFIVLGLILVGVSWIYTRFRERIQRYL